MSCSVHVNQKLICKFILIDCTFFFVDILFSSLNYSPKFERLKHLLSHLEAVACGFSCRAYTSSILQLIVLMQLSRLYIIGQSQIIKSYPSQDY